MPEKQDITIWVRSVNEAPGGGRREIYLTVTDGVHLSDECYTVMRSFFAYPAEAGAALNPEQYEALVQADAFSRAAMRGADLLNLSDHTAKQLRDKLLRRGFDRDAANAAVSYLESKGAIQEEHFMVRSMEYMCNTKHWGPNKVNMELVKRGFDRQKYAETYQMTMDSLDFIAACRYRVAGIGVEKLTDYATRQKHYAALLRQGFSGSHIRQALELEASEESE